MTSALHRLWRRSGLSGLKFDGWIAFENWLLTLPGHRFRIVVLRAVNRSHVGAGCAVERRVRLTTIGGLQIGSNSNINRAVVLDARGTLQIGSHVNISPEVMLLSAEHLVDSPDFEGVARPVVVQDRVWIATRAMILPGVTVGEGAVVAAGAVVRSDVAPWTIVAGVPAKVVGHRDQRAQQSLGKPYRRWLQ